MKKLHQLVLLTALFSSLLVPTITNAWCVLNLIGDCTVQKPAPSTTINQKNANTNSTDVKNSVTTGGASATTSSASSATVNVDLTQLIKTLEAGNGNFSTQAALLLQGQAASLEFTKSVVAQPPVIPISNKPSDLFNIKINQNAPPLQLDIGQSALQKPFQTEMSQTDKDFLSTLATSLVTALGKLSFNPTPISIQNNLGTTTIIQGTTTVNSLNQISLPTLEISSSSIASLAAALASSTGSTTILFTPALTLDASSTAALLALASSTNNMSNFIGAGGSASNLQSANVLQTAHGFAVGDWVYINGAGTYAKAKADAPTTAEAIGVVTTVTDANNFKITTAGYVTGLTGLVADQVYYISAATAGAITATEPSAVSSVSKPALVSDSTTSGYIELYRGTPAQGQTAVVQYGSNTTITDAQTTTSATFVDVTGGNFVLPVGTFEVIYTTMTSNTGANNDTYFRIVDPSAAVVANSISAYRNPAALSRGGQTWKVNVIVATAGTYKLQWATNGGGTATIMNANNAGATGDGSTGIFWSQIGASPVPMDLVGEYVAPIYGAASVNPTGTTLPTAIDYLSITLPSAGIWSIDWLIRGSTNSVTNAGIGSVLTDNSNVVQPNSEVLTYFPGVTAANGQASGKGQYIVTTTGSATYKVRVFSVSNTGGSVVSDANGRSFVTARKISGFTPSSGQTVDYVIVKNKVTTANVANQAFFKPDTIVAGNIPYNATTGLFTLTAGKTYELVADLAIGGGSSGVPYVWKDNGSGVQIGSQGVNIFDGGVSGAQNVLARAIYTPSVNTTVGVVNIFTGAFPLIGSADTTSGTTGLSQPSMTIKQLGTSAAITNSKMVGSVVGPMNSAFGTITVGDIGGGTSGVVTSTGIISTATKTNIPSSDSTIAVTYPNNGTPQGFLLTIRSLSNSNDATLVIASVDTNFTTTGATIRLREVATVVENIALDVVIIY